MKLIIAIQKKVGLHGLRVRGFNFDTNHNLHIWQGKEFTPEEFNKVAKDVFHANTGLAPFALVVGAGDAKSEVGGDDSALREENAKLRLELEQLKSALNPPAVRQKKAAVAKEEAALV